MEMEQRATGTGDGCGAFEIALSSWGAVLQERAYSHSTIGHHVRIGRKFAEYVSTERVAISEVAERHIDDFVRSRSPDPARREGTRRAWRGALHGLLSELRRTGIAARVTVVSPPEMAVFTAYLEFLSSHRGVSQSTVAGQRRILSRLLTHVGARSETDLRSLTPAQIDRFLIETAAKLARGSMGSLCAAVRGFLRYLALRSIVGPGLAEQVTGPRIYALEGLPRWLDWETVQRVLDGVERSTVTGRRDYAVLVLLATCGLRAGEVAGLQLGDLDWKHDRIRLRRNKTGITDDIPLAPVVGDALIDYLRHRPKLPSFPATFLRVYAPILPMSSHCVTAIVRKYMTLAGVDPSRRGAHVLRHSFAVHLLREGFPLKTISDALGHKDPRATYIYTKAGVDDLREVALGIEEVVS